MSKRALSFLVCFTIFIFSFSFSSFADSSVVPVGYLNNDYLTNVPVYDYSVVNGLNDYSAACSLFGFKELSLNSYTDSGVISTVSEGLDSWYKLELFNGAKLDSSYSGKYWLKEYFSWLNKDSLNSTTLGYLGIGQSTNYPVKVSRPVIARSSGTASNSYYVFYFYQTLDGVYHVSSSGGYSSMANGFISDTYFSTSVVTHYSSSKLVLVNTVPTLDVSLSNIGNLTKGKVSLILSVKLNNPSTLEKYVWKDDLGFDAVISVLVGDSGTTLTTNIISPLGSPFVYSWKSGRSYTLTLSEPKGLGLFGDACSLNVLDTLTFTVDGTAVAEPDIEQSGKVTYSPTTPSNPANGDVNVIIDASGSIIGSEIYDGSSNTWVIIDQITINNGSGTGSDSGGSSSGSTGGGSSGSSLWDSILSGLGSVITGLFKLIGTILSSIISGVTSLLDGLGTLINSILEFVTGGFTDFLKAFFYWMPPELVAAFTAAVLLGSVLALLRFFLK